MKNKKKYAKKDEIKSMRLYFELTQTQVAHMINKHLRTWQKYESGERKMDFALFDYFLIKANENLRKKS